MLFVSTSPWVLCALRGRAYKHHTTWKGANLDMSVLLYRGSIACNGVGSNGETNTPPDILPSSLPRPQEVVASHPARLFQCSNASGRFTVEEIFDFTQEVGGGKGEEEGRGNGGGEGEREGGREGKGRGRGERGGEGEGRGGGRERGRGEGKGRGGKGRGDGRGGGACLVCSCVYHSVLVNLLIAVTPPTRALL